MTLGQLSTYESAQERKETSHASHQRRYQSQGNHSLESPSLQFGVHHMITGFCFVLTKSYFISNDRASWGWRCLCKTGISVHNRYCHVAMYSQQDLSVQKSLSPSWYSCAFSIIISQKKKKKKFTSLPLEGEFLEIPTKQKTTQWMKYNGPSIWFESFKHSNLFPNSSFIVPLPSSQFHVLRFLKPTEST